jgi:hypothetical protein
VAGLARQRAEPLALQQPRHHALDHPDRAGARPHHARDRRGEEPPRVVGAQDQLDDLVAHVGRQDIRGALGHLLRLGVVAQRDRRERRHPERERDQGDGEEPGQRGDVIAEPGAPVELDGVGGQTPRTDDGAMHEPTLRAARAGGITRLR